MTYPPGKVRIYCGCGREIWDHPDALVRSMAVRIPKVEELAICSDCLMKLELSNLQNARAIRAEAELYPNPDI